MSSSQGLSTSDSPGATSQEWICSAPWKWTREGGSGAVSSPQGVFVLPLQLATQAVRRRVAQPALPFLWTGLESQPRMGKHRLPNRASHSPLTSCCGRRLINTSLNHFAFYRNEAKEGSGEGRKQSVSETYPEEEKSRGWVSQGSGTGTLVSAR